MKGITLSIIIGITAVSAVEWQTEQVNKTPNSLSYYSQIALDPQGAPRLLFFEMNPGGAFLRMASKYGGSWSIKDVSRIYYEAYYEYWSLDIDSKGKNLVAYTNMDTTANSYQLCLASDSGGSFVTKVLLSDNEESSLVSTMKVGDDGKVYILYFAYNSDSEAFYLRYGWFDGKTFNSEKIADLGSDYYIMYADFLLVNGLPHVFYSDPNLFLQHATKSSAYSAGWITEAVSDTLSALPSADADAKGNLYVSYRTDEFLDSIMYATNKGGAWHRELVTRTREPEGVEAAGVSLALDSQGTPNLIWCDSVANGSYDVRFGRKSTTG